MSNPDPRSKKGQDQRRKMQQGQNSASYNQPEQEVKQGTTQGDIQLADHTWERLLCALERLEYVTEQVQIQRTATRLDRHRDKDNIQTSVSEAQEEVNLQVSAFWYVVKPVRSDLLEWLLKDFICWLAGRERMGLQLNITDEYTIPVIDCILGVPYKSLNLPELILSTTSTLNFDIKEPLKNLATAQLEIDQLEDEFRENPQKKATQHTHKRGNIQEGMKRLQNTAQTSGKEKWLARFNKECRLKIQKE